MDHSHQLEHGHEPDEIAQRLAGGPRISYLRDWVYGGIDGAVTTFAVVAGVEGAGLSPAIVLVLGAANLLADGFSMAASNYSATKAEMDDARRIQAMERRHIRTHPEGEREEVRQIFASKGFKGQVLEEIVDVITASEARWLETMMTEEHGLPPQQRSPLKGAVATFISFFVCGGIPLVPFIFGAGASLEIASAMTAVVFFTIGSLKSVWSTARWWRSGLETLSIGAAAAVLAYGAGYFLRSLV